MPRLVPCTRRALFTLLLSLSLVTAVHAGEITIGDIPVTIDLEGQWNRSEFAPGSGRDQFVGPNGVRIIFIQRPAPIGGVEGERHLLELMIDGMAASPEFTVEQGLSESTFESGRALFRSAVSTQAGIEIHWRIGLLSQGPIVHLVMAMAPLVAREQLQPTIDEIVADFPRLDDTTRSRVAARSRSVDRPWGRFNIELSPYRWESTALGEAVLGMENFDGDELYLFEYEDDTTEELVEILREFYRSQEFRLVFDRSSELAEFEGHELHAIDAEGSAIRAFVVAIGEGRHLEFRLESGQQKQILDVAWPELLAAVSLDVHPPVFAFPEPDFVPEGETHPPGAPEWTAHWLSRATWLGSASGVRANAGLPVEGGVFVYGDGGVMHIDDERSTLWVTRLDESLAAGSLWYEDGEVFIAPNGVILHEGEQGWAPLEPRQRERARVGSVLYIVTDGVAADRPLFLGLPEVEPSKLLAIRGGEMTEIEELRDRYVSHLFSDRSGTLALLGTEPLNLDETRPRWDRTSLEALDENGERTPLGEWDVRSVGLGDGEWLVTGTPVGGRTGVHRVRPGEPPQLLVSGYDFRGISIDRERVVLAGSVMAPALDGGGGTALYAIDRETLSRLGPRTMPFDPPTLTRLARGALAEAGGTVAAAFADRASIAAFVAHASALAESICQRPLPTDRESLDAAFSTWIRAGSKLDTDAITLLTALYTHVALEEGARWVAGDAPAAGLRISEPMGRATSFARAYNPAHIVWRTLFDDDAYWRPVAEVASECEGRVQLLGFDPDAMHRALGEYSDDAALELLEQDDIAPVVALLESHAENIYLRYEVLDHLVARGRWADVRACAAPFLRSEAPLYFDQRADLNARRALLGDDPDPAALEALIESMLSLIRRFPNAAPSYLLLGSLYAERWGPGDDRRARACYDKVLSITDGSWARLAERSIEELGGRDSPPPDGGRSEF